MSDQTLIFIISSLIVKNTGSATKVVWYMMFLFKHYWNNDDYWNKNSHGIIIIIPISNMPISYFKATLESPFISNQIS